VSETGIGTLRRTGLETTVSWREESAEPVDEEATGGFRPWAEAPETNPRERMSIPMNRVVLFI